MPAKMPTKKTVARIGGEPGREIGARGVCLSALVTNMREPVRTMRVVRVCGHGALDDRPPRREFPSSDNAAAKMVEMWKWRMTDHPLDEGALWRSLCLIGPGQSLDVVRPAPPAKAFGGRT
jgi:hypothetical protein